ncbi:MAG: type II toxin-antitoxin system VapC family toxin [Myxococcota bacterium]
MKFLLDTHVFLWWISDSPKLSQAARQRLADSRCKLYWSTASTWEASIKFALGRLPLPLAPEKYLPRHLERNGIQSLPITDVHAYAAASLPSLHADPFDRMLVAQSQIEELRLITGDEKLRAYNIAITW